MPIFQIYEPTANIKIGLWELTETTEEIFQLLKKFNIEEDSPEISTYKTYTNQERIKQWLCARLLLFTILGNKTSINYTATGKPYLSAPKLNIGISHTNGFVAAIISPFQEVAIDIEKITSKIERVIHKFLSQNEINNVDDLQKLLHLHIYWGAKESLFKMHPSGNLVYTKDIRVNSFQPGESGKLSAEMELPLGTEKYTLDFRKIKEFVLVWTAK
jgi:4'-phosphopantetheinyl transferase